MFWTYDVQIGTEFEHGGAHLAPPPEIRVCATSEYCRTVPPSNFGASQVWIIREFGFRGRPPQARATISRKRQFVSLIPIPQDESGDGEILYGKPGGVEERDGVR